jgi:regulator of replication initiation timing
MAVRRKPPRERAAPKSKRRLVPGFFMLAILSMLTSLACQSVLPSLENLVILVVALAWSGVTGVVLPSLLFPQEVPLSRDEYQRLVGEVERLSAENKALREENNTLRMRYEDLSGMYQSLSATLSSRERELTSLRGEYEALKTSLEAPDLEEWRRSVLEKASLSGRDYTMIYMLVKQADELARLGYKAYARVILQAAYNLLQDRLVDRKLVLLWEVGERPPADLQKAVRG